eukprot:NODE_744_length_713_cov_170.599398_g677_i0.p1 GENE.NODE_744_length_713_cov_170.599398_g677_i0~~NODE_744_length_713_cov_170.599398_g677_i0.p1  ORF type:complete len:165 (+),score=16.05 NODE_744_length_713_cov_170.599398_g677_i0:65-559(+)
MPREAIGPAWSRAEELLCQLDTSMVEYKRFQTRSDWNIEVQRRKDTWKLVPFGLFTWAAFRTAVMDDCSFIWRLQKSEAGFRLWYHMMKNSSRWRLRPGLASSLCGVVPAWMTVLYMNHQFENKRLNMYLRQPTVFGEIARNLAHRHPYPTWEALQLVGADMSI